MKKYILAFLVIFSLCFITYTPVNATSIAIPFSDVPALYYSFGTIAAGGSINLEDYDNAQDYIADLNRLLRGQEIQNNAYGMTGTTSKTLFNKLASLALSGVTELSADGSLVISYDNVNTAQFMSYDKNYYKYLIASGNDVVVPNPDPNYSQYLNILNGSGFVWKDMAMTYDNVNPNYTITDASDFSWFYNNNNFGGSLSIQDSLSLYNIIQGLMFSPVLTFDINGSDNNYNLSLRDSAINYSYMYSDWSSQYFDGNYNGTLYTNAGRLVNAMVFNNYWIVNPSKFTYNGSLDACLNYLSKYMRNINLYVNGDLWLAGDLPVSNPPILSPDLVGIGDLPDDTYGVLGLNEPVNLDLGAFLGWLQDLIDLGKDVIGLGDLVDSDDLPFLRTKDTDTDIDLDNTNVIPAEQVIDDPKEKEEEHEDTNPDPEPPDPDPPFPAPLPPILPVPDPNITPRQTTVLSEIIQATDTVVPSELMTLIWSTFGLLVVGGLIYILHK